MGEVRGFTLIELLVVIVIMAIATAIGFSLSGWENRTAAESQVKQVYADLMNARELAITQKRWVYVIFADDPVNNNLYDYNIYADTDDNGAYDPANDKKIGPGWKPDGKIAMFVNLAQNYFQLSISPDGSLINPAGVAYPVPIFMQSATPPQLNCITWSETAISLGGWSPPGSFPGGSCAGN